MKSLSFSPYKRPVRKWPVHVFLPGPFPVIIAFLTAMILLPQTSFAQSFELTPYGGYMFGGKIRGYNGELKIQDNANYGGILSFSAGRGAYMELMYNRQDSEARLTRFGEAGSNRLFNISSNYFQVQMLRESFSSSENLRPFGMVGVGAAVFVPKTSAYSDKWFFSASIGGGVKAYFNERLGLRLQGRLLMPLLFSGGGLWCTGGDCAIGVSSYSAILQGDFTAGLIFLFDR